MSVLKNLRKLSSMEFYKNALRIRKEITKWLLCDFGYRRNPKRVEQIIKDIDEADQNTINEIFQKYGQTTGYATVYPSWFVEFERAQIMRVMEDMIENIARANFIYARLECEWDLRRSYQDKAIGDCYVLYSELQYIKESFGNGTDMNKFIPILEAIDKEEELLKGWRQSDNKLRKKTVGNI
jgi:hypothetical protein